MPREIYVKAMYSCKVLRYEELKSKCKVKGTGGGGEFFRAGEVPWNKGTFTFHLQHVKGRVH